jgi:hypothetical protein
MRLTKSAARKKTSFVPRIIFQAATVVGVVPFCVAGCGGISLGPIPDGGGDVVLGDSVACVSFDGGPCRLGVADVGFTVAACAFDSGDGVCAPRDAQGVAADAFGVAADAFGVAADAFGVAADAFGVAADAFGVADAGFADAPFGVAADAFGGHSG